MADKVAVTAYAAASGVAGYGWLTTANDLATLVVSVLTAIGISVAALYHLERFKNERIKRRKEQEKDDG